MHSLAGKYIWISKPKQNKWQELVLWKVKCLSRIRDHKNINQKVSKSWRIATCPNVFLIALSQNYCLGIHIQNLSVLNIHQQIVSYLKVSFIQRRLNSSPYWLRNKSVNLDGDLCSNQWVFLLQLGFFKVMRYMFFSSRLSFQGIIKYAVSK